MHQFEAVRFGMRLGCRDEGGSKTLIYSSLDLGHGMAMSLQSLEPGSVGAWLAVP